MGNDLQEALVFEFKRMHDEVEGYKMKDSSFEIQEHFSKLCASTLVQLDEVNDQACFL